MSTRLDDLIEFAIRNEVEAAEFYQKHSALVKEPVQRTFLASLAATERKHERKLRGLAASGPLALSPEIPRSDLKIADFLVDVSIVPESSIKDVFVYAIKAEQKTFELYSKLSELEMEALPQELFSLLAAEELGHKNALEREFEKEFGCGA